MKLNSSFMRVLCAILFFTLFFSFFVYAQQDSIIKTNSHPYLKYFELNEEQWDAWNTMDSTWSKDYFKSCLAENGLRLNCEDCENAYLTVKFDIDSTGIIKNFSNVKSNICGSEIPLKLEKSFMYYFLNIQFPTILRGLKIEVTIGNGLKC